MRSILESIVVKFHLSPTLQTGRSMGQHLGISQSAMPDDDTGVIVKISRLVIDIVKDAVFNIKVAGPVCIRHAKCSGIKPWFLALVTKTP